MYDIGCQQHYVTTMHDRPAAEDCTSKNTGRVFIGELDAKVYALHCRSYAAELRRATRQLHLFEAASILEKKKKLSRSVLLRQASDFERPEP